MISKSRDIGAERREAELVTMKRRWFRRGLLHGMEARIPLYTDDSASGYKAMLAEYKAHRHRFMGSSKYRSQSVRAGIELDWKKIGEDLSDAIGQWGENQKA